MSNPLLQTGDIAVLGGVQHNPASAHSRELCKFERTWTQYGPPGLPPYVPSEHPYPARLYKATRDELGRAQFAGETANDEHEQRNLESRGYVAGGQGCALERLEQDEREVAKLAAERAANERTMSEGARREAAAVDDATDLHVPMIPETPIRRGPGRPRKEDTDVSR